MNKKKNLLWLLSLLMIVSVSFTSCNKDDDDDVVPVADLKTAIIGKWKSVSDVVYVDGKEIRDESEYYTDDKYYVDELKSDGTYLDLRFVNGKRDPSYKTHGTWELKGDILIYDNDEDYPCKVTIKGNTLIMIEEDTFVDDDNKEHTLKNVCTYTKIDFVSGNKDDDDDDVDLKSAILGQWKSLSRIWYVDGEVDENESEYYDDNQYFVDDYKSDGTYIYSPYVNGVLDENENDLGEWKLEGDTLIFDDDMEFKVTINGNTLILTTEWTEMNDGVAQKWKIVDSYTKL